MKKIKLLCAAGLLGALAMTSCTDLTEKVYSDLVRDNYYTDKLSVEAAVVRCFEHSDNVTWRGDIWKLQELTGDHFVWTQKGRHGYDDVDAYQARRHRYPGPHWLRERHLHRRARHRRRHAHRAADLTKAR